jgi:hypothetical protein
MATSQAAYGIEKAIGHDDSSILQQDVSNYKQTGDANQTMKALCWMGKGKVQVGLYNAISRTPFNDTGSDLN